MAASLIVHFQMYCAKIIFSFLIIYFTFILDIIHFKVYNVNRS